MKQRIALLGSTGSIGLQTLDIARARSDRFEIAVLTAGTNWQRLAEQAAEFLPDAVVIADEQWYAPLREALAHLPIKVYAGAEAIVQVVRGGSADVIVNALVGYAGMMPSLAAVETGKKLALANKETLVAAGEIVMGLAEKHNAVILPVDSEHSAIFQCLQGSHGAEIEKIHLTASGGPFREWTREDIARASAAMALKHPKWTMGSKITIDSATMMNKGLEIIEAKWLFGVDASKINVVVHPQSIIHSMVEFADGAVIAQLGHPDMREPIQYALAYPERLSLSNLKIDFAELASLSFYAPDREKFPAIGIAFDALEKGGNMPCIMNAANEAAVAAYLQDRIGFYDITGVVCECMAGVDFVGKPDLDAIFRTNEEAYAKASEIIGKISSAR